MTRLLLVRHAESEWNAARRWQGQSDPPLSVHGREQAAAAVPRVRGLVTRVACSDLVRARHTAEIVAGALGLGSPHVEPGLREIDVGEWSGLTIEQVEERWADELRAWRAGTLDAPPGGEDRHAFLRRVSDAVASLAAAGPDHAWLVVTHGGCIGRLERHLEVFPGRGPGHLAGRWFEFDGDGLRPDGDRVELLAEWTPPPPEAR